MTLTTYPDIVQGTTEWADLRRGLVTASNVGKLITPTLKVASNDVSRGLTATLAAERITGWTENIGMTSDMFRGVQSEPVARDVYSGHYHQAEEFGFFLREETNWKLGFSPDGVVGTDGLLEVKAPRAKTHLRTILAGEVPTHYLAQCMAGLLVTGRAWIDFCSYVGGMPLFVRRVYPDQRWFDAITAACIEFEKNVAALVSDYEGRVTHMPKTERIDFDLEVVI